MYTINMSFGNEFKWRERVGFTNINLDVAYEIPAWMRTEEHKFTVAFDQARLKLEQLNFITDASDTVQDLKEQIVSKTPYELTNAYAWIIAYFTLNKHNKLDQQTWTRVQHILQNPPNLEWKELIESHGLTPPDLLRYILCLIRIL